jgi:hypothetical protein
MEAEEQPLLNAVTKKPLVKALQVGKYLARFVKSVNNNRL